MRAFIRFLRLAVTVTAGILIIGTVTVGAVYFYFASDLPNITSFKDYRPPVVSEVYDDAGQKMGEFWIECRFKASIDEIPKLLIQAFISAEDSRFFEHKGVDVRGIGRAFFENLKAGHVVQGGSTITQQIVRSILLSNERSYIRKIKEAILATRIDRTLSKKEILEIYLNQIFLGNRAYGVKAAARNYFHKEMKDVTIAEAAMVAGLTQAPTADNPVASPDKAKERQLYVLERMRELGYITKAEYKAAVDENITVYESEIDKDFNHRYAPYFTEEIRRMIQEKYGDKVLYEGGLKIYTTGNTFYNQAAQKAVRHGLEAIDRRQSSFRGPIARLKEDEIPGFIENVHKEALGDKYGKVSHIPETAEDKERKSGPTPLVADEYYQAVFASDGGKEIKVGHNTGTLKNGAGSWSGGWGNRFAKGDVVYVKITDTDGVYELTQVPKVQSALFSMVPETGFVKAVIGGFDFKFSEFDRATQALRQPGSSFKPFVYSSALDKGYTYATPVSDSPVSYKVGDEIWTPKNYGNSFSGGQTFENNLVYSRNVPAVKVAASVGTHYIVAYARKMGLTNYFYKYLSMALGANSVYLQEMVNAYATIANYGRKPDRIYITKIVDLDGNVLEEYQPKEFLPPNVAYLQSKNADPNSTELNTELFEANKHWIESDGLKLSDEELRILYGKAIPEGYVMPPQTAALMMGLMKQVVERGTAVRVKAIGRPAAGKTGTTNEETDAWFIGFTPELAAGVWVGNDVKKTIGRGEQGGRTAAPAFIEYIQAVMKDVPVEDFKPLENYPEKVAELKGGAAIYCTGLTKETVESGGAWYGTTHSVQDRAVDFYEEDAGF